MISSVAWDDPSARREFGIAGAALVLGRRPAAAGQFAST